jgi:hypothetical protein
VPEAEKSEIHGDRPAAFSSQGLADHKELAAFAFGPGCSLSFRTPASPTTP